MSQPVLSRHFGLPGVGVGDIVFGLVVSVGGIVSVSGLRGPVYPHEGVIASLAVLLMTAPVVYARRNPILAAGVLAGGAALNWLVIGDMVRCGAALPAAFYVSFMIGSRCKRLGDIAIGVALVAGNIVCQAFSDPQLEAGVIVYMVPIALGFTIAGWLHQGRTAAVARLRVRTAELRAQREQNAKLAVAADQVRIAEDLDGFLHDRVGLIAAAAATGRATLGSEPDEAKGAFVAIQDAGRETLAHMRGVVASLRDPALTEPQPVLAQLDRLLGQATQTDARLRVIGDPRMLPPGVELSGYRIVEHLLVALDNDPAASVDVLLTFGPSALELTVSGPSSSHGDARAALAAARERATMLGGTLRTRAIGGRLETVVLLPLVAGHV